jgi:hypothetical protein
MIASRVLSDLLLKLQPSSVNHRHFYLICSHSQHLRKVCNNKDNPRPIFRRHQCKKSIIQQAMKRAVQFSDVFFHPPGFHSKKHPCFLLSACFVDTLFVFSYSCGQQHWLAIISLLFRMTWWNAAWSCRNILVQSLPRIDRPSATTTVPPSASLSSREMTSCCSCHKAHNTSLDRPLPGGVSHYRFGMPSLSKVFNYLVAVHGMNRNNLFN